MKPTEPAQPAGTVRLYHGTTLQAADQIVLSGFKPLDRVEVVQTVARECGVSVDSLHASLAGTFLDALGRHDENFISFKKAAIQVEFWARIGGEARWEALKAVFLQNHPDAGIDSREATEWAEGGSNLRHAPAVVAVDVPYDSFRDQHGGPSTIEEWHREPEMFRLAGVIELNLPIPMAWIAGRFRVEPALDAARVATRLGVNWAAVSDLVRDGALPPSDDIQGAPPRWWTSTVLPFLPGTAADT